MLILFKTLQLICLQNQYISNSGCQNCPQNSTNDPLNPYNCICQQNQYFDSEKQLCSQCLGTIPSNTSFCVCNTGFTYDYQLKQCKENCPTGQYRYNGQCKVCPQGTSDNKGNNSLCTCNNTQYFEPQQGICIDCPPDSTVDVNNRCICNVLDYIIVNGACQLVCGGQYIQFQNKCQQCPVNSTRFNDSICTCQNDQQLNIYYNIQLNQCLKCPNGTQASTSTCICPLVNYTFNQSSFQCEQSCPVGFYAFNETLCMQCPANAIKCENNTAFCQNLFAIRRNTSQCVFDFSWVIITSVFLIFFTIGMVVNMIGASSQISYLNENAMMPEYVSGAPQRIKIRRSYYKQPKVKKDRIDADGSSCKQCCTLCYAKMKDNQRGLRNCCERCAESRSNFVIRNRERNKECTERCKRCCAADSCRTFFKEKLCAECHCGCLCCCEACL